MGRETGKIPATAFRAASCNSLSEYVDAPSEDVKRFFFGFTSDGMKRVRLLVNCLSGAMATTRSCSSFRCSTKRVEFFVGEEGDGMVSFAG